MNDLFRRMAKRALRELEKHAEEKFREFNSRATGGRGFGADLRAEPLRPGARSGQFSPIRDRMMAEGDLDEMREKDLPRAERSIWMEVLSLRKTFRHRVSDVASREEARLRELLESAVVQLKKRLDEESDRIGRARLRGVDWWDPAIFDSAAKQAAAQRGRDELAKIMTALRDVPPPNADSVKRALAAAFGNLVSTLEQLLVAAEGLQAGLSLRAPFNREMELTRLKYSQEQVEGKIVPLVAPAEAGLRAALDEFEGQMLDALAAFEVGADSADLPPGWRVEPPIPFETLRSQYTRPALLLHRPFPPYRAGAGRSRVGGLPDLPSGMDWPRTGRGTALHFLAQIDLAEMPLVDRAVPRTGTLLFFAHMTGDLDMGPNDREQVRVLFDATSSGMPVEPPQDLAALATPRRSLLNEAGLDRRCYPSWPLEGVKIESLPTIAALDPSLSDARYAAYAREEGRFRRDQVIVATGMQPSSDGRLDIASLLISSEDRQSRRMKPFDQSGFPWVRLGYGLMVGALTPILVEHPSLEFQLTRFRSIAAAGAPEDRVEASEAADFIACLDHMLASGRGPAQRIVAALAGTAETLVILAGGDPRLAAALPDSLYALTYPRHVRESSHHQMFGYVPSSQEPLPAAARTQTLLQLRSDYGVDLVIGDVGELEFRIDPEDLENLRWERTAGIYAGA